MTSKVYSNEKNNPQTPKRVNLVQLLDVKEKINCKYPSRPNKVEA